MTLAHFQQIKNSAVLDTGQGIFKNLYFVGFKFKDFKMCPQGQGCPQGLHLYITALELCTRMLIMTERYFSVCNGLKHIGIYDCCTLLNSKTANYSKFQQSA